MTLFQEHILNAPDVCNNCFARVRRERAQTASTDPKSLTSVEKSPYTRVKTQTDLGHGPGDTPTQCQGVWCECGVESAFERIWDDGDDRCLTMRRVKDYLKTLIRTLEAKGITLDRETTIKLAMQRYRNDHDITAAFKTAVQAGVQTAAASSTPSSTTAPLSE